METLIQVEELYKSYRRDSLEIPVLAKYQSEIAQGEFIAFMGPSGSGKTTLLNLIAGIDKPTSGRIVIGGVDVAEIERDRARGLALAQRRFYFQFYNLIPVLDRLGECRELPLILTPLPKKSGALTPKQL